MAEGDLPGIAEQEIQSDCKDGVYADKYQHIQKIPSLEKQWNAKKDCGKEQKFCKFLFH
jgi:hypothetical protein